MATLGNLFGGAEPEEPETETAAVAPSLSENLAGIRKRQLSDLAMEDQERVVDVYEGAKARGDQFLEQHQDFRRQGERAQSIVAARQADLAALQNFYQVTDSSVPKPARKYLWGGFVKSLGGDPASPAAKELGGMLNALDPDSLGLLRRALADSALNAQSPTAIREMLAGVVTGRVPPQALLQRVQDFASREQQSNLGRVEAGFPQVAGSHEVAPGTREEFGPMGVERPAGYQTAPIHSEVIPELSGLLPDLEPGTRYRYGDLQDRGYVAVPSDAAGQRTMAQTIREQNANSLLFFDRIGRLGKLVPGNAAALGPVGTGTQVVDAIGSALEGIGNLTGLVPRDPAFDPTKGQTRFETERASKNIAKMIGGTAADAAKIKSLVAEAGYVIAGQMFGQTGRALSDTDYAAAIRTLGESQSPEQFMGVLRSLGERAYQTYTAKMETATGRADVDMNVRRMGGTQITELLQSPVIPGRLRDRLEDEAERRMALERPRQPAPQRAGEPRSEQPAPERRTDNRQQPTIEQEEQSFRDRAAAAAAQADAILRRREERSEGSLRLQQEGTTLARESFEYRQQKDREDKEEAAALKLQKAIAEFGAAVGSAGGSVSVGRGGGGDSGAQDANAFKLPQRSSRRAPQVPNLPLTGFKNFGSGAR